MILDSIKTLLGDELTKQVEAALKGKSEGGKDVDLVVGNDGGYLPKVKFDELNEKYKAADQLAKDTQKALDGLKAAGDPAKLKADLEAAQTAAREAAEKHKTDMAAKDLDYAIRNAITDAHDPALVASLVDQGKLKLLDDGKVAGLDEALKAIRAEKPFLFKPAGNQDPPLNGGKPAPAGGSGGGGGTTKKFSEMNYTERLELKTKNPELYNQLAGGK